MHPGYAQMSGINVSTNELLNDTGRIQYLQSYLTSVTTAMRYNENN